MIGEVEWIFQMKKFGQICSFYPAAATVYTDQTAIWRGIEHSRAYKFTLERQNRLR